MFLSLGKLNLNEGIDNHTKLFRPDLKPELNERINTLLQEAEKITNEIKNLKQDTDLGNQKLSKIISLEGQLAQLLEIINLSVLENKIHKTESEIKAWESYNSRLPEGMRFANLPENYENMQVLESLEKHDDWVNTLQVLPDGRIVSGSSDKSIKISEKKNGEWISETIGGHDRLVRTLQVLPDGRIVSGGGDGKINILEQKNGKWIFETLEGHDNWVRTLQVLPDGRIVSGGDDGVIKILGVDED